MTATLRPRVSVNLVRHDTAGEWILPSTPTGSGSGRGAAPHCGSSSPVRENWTILSESQVEISYKAALSATPATAPSTPFEGDASVTRVTSARQTPSKSSPKVGKEPKTAIAANVSSDEDFGFNQRKSRVAGNGANKSRNNRRK
jgi:hypothetical protein